jgi:hypothetical protein
MLQRTGTMGSMGTVRKGTAEQFLGVFCLEKRFETRE